jgi:hypothetical protein
MFFLAHKNKFKISNIQAQSRILIQVRGTSQNFNAVKILIPSSHRLVQWSNYWSVTDQLLISSWAIMPHHVIPTIGHMT